jgi:hypothetical protein
MDVPAQFNYWKRSTALQRTDNPLLSAIQSLRTACELFGYFKYRFPVNPAFQIFPTALNAYETGPSKFFNMMR